MLQHYLSNVTLTEIKLHDPILAARLETCRTVTIPSSLKKCYDTHRIEAFELNWTPEAGEERKPHVFWDSDVAKVLEGMAYMLALAPDAAMEAEYDKIVALILSAQQPDGYLNTHFTVVEPEQRWSNLCLDHELYCAGHLMEAAVAGFELLGKRPFLDAMCRYADYIDSVFGVEPGKKRGVPGHEEIELALVRLFHATGNERYKRLAEYFVNERGASPNYFKDVEKHEIFGGPRYQQAHIPVREQQTADGHSVRAVYLYSGMADVAMLSRDETLFEACRTLLDNIMNRRMYLTGGIGSSFEGETFTCDYNLENSTLMYAESCAAIGLALFARRMYLASGEGRYMDLVERALFNGVLSGISLSGDKFFYTNYLEVDDNLFCYNAGSPVRKAWFDCSCCPTSFCRFIPESLGFLWSDTEEEVRLDIPLAQIRNSRWGVFEVEGRYPYDGAIQITLPPGAYAFAVRVPSWCRHADFSAEGGVMRDGYACYPAGFWKQGGSLQIRLEMAVETVRSVRQVTNNAGRIALMRGPIVYCCESVDNQGEVSNLILDSQSRFQVIPATGLPEGTPAITGDAWREIQPAGTEDALYYIGTPERKRCRFTAIPYALWQNRGASKMAVWMRSAR